MNSSGTRKSERRLLRPHITPKWGFFQMLSGINGGTFPSFSTLYSHLRKLNKRRAETGRRAGIYGVLQPCGADWESLRRE